MISLDEQLKYLKINTGDNTYIRTLKLIVHSFSFYTIGFTLLSFFFNLDPKIKLFFIVLLIINAVVGSLIVHKKADRIKKLLLVEDKTRLLFHEKMFHITIIIAMIIFFKPPKIDKMDILYSFVACFVMLNIYLSIFNEKIIYMNFMPKKRGFILYTSLFLLMYIGVYFYTNM